MGNCITPCCCPKMETRIAPRPRPPSRASLANAGTRRDEVGGGAEGKKEEGSFVLSPRGCIGREGRKTMHNLSRHLFFFLPPTHLYPLSCAATMTKATQQGKEEEERGLLSPHFHSFPTATHRRKNQFPRPRPFPFEKE